jgi:hypothetical protein
MLTTITDLGVRQCHSALQSLRSSPERAKPSAREGAYRAQTGGSVGAKAPPAIHSQPSPLLRPRYAAWLVLCAALLPLSAAGKRCGGWLRVRHLPSGRAVPNHALDIPSGTVFPEDDSMAPRRRGLLRRRSHWLGHRGTARKSAVGRGTMITTAPSRSRATANTLKAGRLEC